MSDAEKQVAKLYGVGEDRVHDQTTTEGAQREDGLRPISEPPESDLKGEEARPPRPPVAKAQEAQPDFRSKTEGRWAARLKACTELVWWAFEPVSFRIGEKRHYRPDFVVQRQGGAFEMHEVKGGYVRDRALAKPSAAAALYPQFDWVVVQQAGKTKPWTLKEGWVLPSRPERGTLIAEQVADKTP